MAALPPFSDPFQFTLLSDDPVPTRPFSDPFQFTLINPTRPGPFSDPVSIDTRTDIWFVAADAGWQPAQFLIAAV